MNIYNLLAIINKNNIENKKLKNNNKNNNNSFIVFKKPETEGTMMFVYCIDWQGVGLESCTYKFVNFIHWQ